MDKAIQVFEKLAQEQLLAIRYGGDKIAKALAKLLSKNELPKTQGLLDLVKTRHNAEHMAEDFSILHEKWDKAFKAQKKLK